jgi:hypothetical protein
VSVTDPDAETLLIAFSDKAGACRFDQVQLPLMVKEYAPPAAPVAVSSCAFRPAG